MKLKLLSTAFVSLSIAFTPIQAVASDLLGGVVGGVIGGLIVRDGLVVRKRGVVYSAQRAENRNVQIALNYFLFPAGGADGVFGAKTRRAVSGYQYYMGYPATGALTLLEKDFLLVSYQRAQLGGLATLDDIAASPDGARGLLHVYRDKSVATVDEDDSTPTESGFAAIPTFGGENRPSLASHCTKVSLLTNANGGFSTVASMDDAGFTLSEQFCLARTYAIAESEALVEDVQGLSSAQIQAQCEGIVPPMQDLIAAVSLQSRTEITPSVARFVLQTGMSPAQMTMTARICLGVGYRTDNLDVAIASTLLLVALGKPVYGELLGHHLAKGFGTTERLDLAADWYNGAIAALESGAVPAFAPMQPERLDLLRNATMVLGPDQEDSAASKPAAAIPVFQATE